ncbi:MAG: hypothetical protein K6U87_08855 [Firmicutes bacterium]|nr:hypothetical protein [Bacillota bacterium]
MEVRSNLAALFAENQIAWLSQDLTQWEAQLSTGHQLTDPAQNPADYAIMELFTGQLGELQAGTANVNQGLNLLATANGAIEAQVGILQQLEGLAVQASNATETAQDRQVIQQQVNALLAQLQGIAEAANYNGIELLTGQSASYPAPTLPGVSTANWSGYVAETSSLTPFTAMTGAWNVPSIGGSVGAMVAEWIGLGGYPAGNGDLIQIGIDETETASGPVASVFWEVLSSPAVFVGSVPVGANITASITPVSGQSNTWIMGLTAYDPNGTVQSFSVQVSVSGSYAAEMGQSADWITEDPTIGGVGGALAPLALFSPVTFSDATVDGTALGQAPSPTPLTLVSGSTALIETSALTGGGTGFTTWEPGQESTPLTVRWGGGSAQAVELSLPDATLTGLGLVGLSVGSAAQAQEAITQIHDALTRLTDWQAQIGAAQQQLLGARATVTGEATALAASRSTLADANMATAGSAVAKDQLLLQTALLSLQDAQQLPALALRLLG